ncbi:MAG: hypothetical protein WBO44_07375 [Saprospiraceae bacterium]|jgi:hypothetical protein
MKFIIIYLIFSFISLSSCDKHNGNILSLLNINDFETILGDSMLISDFIQFNESIDNDTCWALLSISCDGLRTYCDLLPYTYNTTYGNVIVSSDSTFNTYSNFPAPITASNINIKLNECTTFYNKYVYIRATTQNSIVYNTSIYSPQKINFTGTLADSMSLTISKSNNFNITWNTDPNSTKGVLITLIYTYQSEPMEDIDFGSDPIFQNILVQDNGSYTLTSQTLSQFPASNSGKHLIITINRGNYTSSSVISNSIFPIIIYSRDKRILKLVP